MDYSHFTAQDFVRDPFFQQSTVLPTAETIAFWQEWLRQHPAQTDAVNEARQLIKTLGFREDVSANLAMIEVWEAIQAERIAPAVTTKRFAGLPQTGWQKYGLQMAAVLAGVAVLATVLYWFNWPEPTTTYATTFGQTQTIVLPDSSVVVLNANSNLSFPTDWDEQKPREVWLSGEAYFQVQEKKHTGQAKFRVYDSNVVVEVLGTKFNVNNRRSQSQIVLASGQVRLSIQQPEKEQQILMKPGELVVVPRGNGAVIKQTVQVDRYTGWQGNRLIFDKTTLREIADLLEDTYGYTVIFSNEKIAEKRFSGSVPAQNPDLLLTTLTRLYDLEINRNDTKLTIRARHL